MPLAKTHQYGKSPSFPQRAEKIREIKSPFFILATLVNCVVEVRRFVHTFFAV